MTIHYGFAPDPVRAASIDRRMHTELARSIEHVSEASRGIVTFDDAACRVFIERLKGGMPALPSTFARYYELVEAICDDRLDEAEALFIELADAPPAPAGLTITTLGSDELNSESVRYARLMNADPSIDIGFQAPAAEVGSAFRDRLDAGLALLDRTLPALAGEIRQIIRQIVICGSDPDKKMQFDGGSHYQLWGALFLNGNYHHSEMAVAEVLAHESAHSLLFGFTTQEPLVENDDDELFSSPLRLDPRPMDGVYHATFVSARMHWAMTKLAASSTISDEQRDYALSAAEADRHNFAAGAEIVAEHGRLSMLGKRLMSSASRYMAQA